MVCSLNQKGRVCLRTYSCTYEHLLFRSILSVSLSEARIPRGGLISGERWLCMSTGVHQHVDVCDNRKTGHVCDA